MFVYKANKARLNHGIIRKRPLACRSEERKSNLLFHQTELTEHIYRIYNKRVYSEHLNLQEIELLHAYKRSVVLGMRGERTLTKNMKSQ